MSSPNWFNGKSINEVQKYYFTMNLKNGVRGVRPSGYGFWTDYADG